jgi:hypothetical protein
MRCTFDKTLEKQLLDALVEPAHALHLLVKVFEQRGFDRLRIHGQSSRRWRLIC